DTPWFKSIVTDIKELIHPPKLPPLELTSKPIDLPDPWGFYGQNKLKSRIYSVAIHVIVIALVVFLGTLKPVQQAVRQTVDLIAPPLSAYMPAKQEPHGG